NAETRQREQTEDALAEATRQQQRADSNFRQAVEEITALLDRANDPRLSGPPQVDSLRQALADRAMKFIPGLLAENRRDPDGRLLTGLAYLALGKAHQIRRDGALAADGYGRALAIFEQGMADFPDDARFRQQRDRATADIFLVADQVAQQGDLLRFAGKLKEAVQAYDITIAIAEKCGPSLDPAMTKMLEVRAR